MNAKSAIDDIILPWKALYSPLKTFRQLAENPSVKGIPLALGIALLIVAAAQYTSATRINLQINEPPAQPIGFPQTSYFQGWFTNAFVSTSLYVVIYWLLFASALALISHFLGGKSVSLRALLLPFASLLPVFTVLYAVRAAGFLALPKITYPLNYWPPASPADYNAAVALMEQTWGSLFAYQFVVLFTFIAIAWLVTLGAIGVRSIREVSWGKAALISGVSFVIAVFVLRGVP